ncbi:hypothetical protein V6N11_008421 [Hibiscus sabdariffa]
MVEELGRASLLLRKGRLQAPLHSHVVTRWDPSPEGWIKVNSNGSRNTRVCSCLEAELGGIYEGLATTWSLQYSHVILETDSREAYDIILSSNGVADAMARLVLHSSLDYRRWMEPPLAICDKLLMDEGYIGSSDITNTSHVSYPLDRAYDDPDDT